MRQVLLIAGGIAAVIALFVGGFTFYQAEREKLTLSADLQYRTSTLADSLEESVEPSLAAHATTTVERIVGRIVDNERLIGLGVFNSTGAPVALSAEFPESISQNPLIARVMDSDRSSGEFIRRANGERVYIFAKALHEDNSVIGALVLAQNAEYIDEAVWGIWRDTMLRLFLQIILLGIVIYLLVRWIFFKPLSWLAESIKAIRRGDLPQEEPRGGLGFLEPLSDEIEKMSASLRQARTAASQEARMRLEKLDSPWTAERLKEFIKAYLKDRPIFVVSNAEPYVHTKVKNKIEVSVPVGGVVTAIEPVMEATGGMWIAAGSGNADKEAADTEGKLRVPPEEPKYTLKRIWIANKDRKGYYDGFSNEALWPLAHLAHVRPVFRKEDWLAYRKVNGLFAKAVLEEIRSIERPIVLVQDYHLALVPEFIKKSRPDAQVALFWHIPWPSAAQFSICPWRKEILEGMLAADIIGFHTQQYCNNFIDTVGSEIEARIDYEKFAIARGGHETRVEPFPISIAFPGNAEITTPPDRSILDALTIRATHLALGVDRLDYVKGIPERFKAVEVLLQNHPEYREKFSLLQIASPTRTGVGRFQEYAQQVLAEATRINEMYGTREWKPIVLEHKSYSHENLRKLYQLADVCLVTSLHDGMNLVAKEYVAARADEKGVLILSQFTGASRDLKSALIVNPYSAEETAEAIHRALTMPESQQRRRMKAMRNSVKDYNVYRWSAELIKGLAELE